MRIPAISAAAVVLPPTLVRNRGMAQMIPNAKRIAGMSNRELKTLNIGSAPCIATDTIAATPIPIKYWRQRWLTGDGLTNVRDFPVPRRHRCARIGLRDQSFQEGKSHEHSVYGWNRLGKKCVFSPWRRCTRSGPDPSHGGASEACAADRPAAAVSDWHGGVLRCSRMGATIRHLWSQREIDGT